MQTEIKKQRKAKNIQTEIEKQINVVDVDETTNNDDVVVVKKRHVKSQDDYINEFAMNVEKHFNVSEKRVLLFLTKHFFKYKTKGPIHKYLDNLMLKLFKGEITID